MSQPTISAFLNRSAFQIRLALFFRSVFLIFTYIALSLLILYALDRLLDFRAITRQILACSLAGCLVYMLVIYFVKPFVRKYSDSDIALITERSFSQFDGRLITVVEIPATSVIINILRQEVITLIEGLPSLPLLNVKRIGKNFLGFVVILAAFLFFTLGFPAEASTFFQRLVGSNIAYPVVKAFEVNLDKDTRVPMGESLSVTAAVINGFSFSQVLLKVKGDEEAIIVMKKVDDSSYVAEIPKITRSLKVWVTAQKRSSEEFLITCVPRPSIVRFQASVVPSEYTGRKEYKLLEGQGNVKLLEGSKVAIELESNKVLSSAFIVVKNTDTKESETIPIDVDEKRASGIFEVKGPGTYTVSLVDSENIESKGLPTYRIRIIKDKAPTVSFERPLSNEKVTPNGAFRLKCKLKDDYGISRCKLFIELSDSGGRIAELEIPVEAGKATVDINSVVDIKLIKFKPGNTFVIRLEIYDSKPDPNVTLTDGIQLKVVRAYEMYEELQNLITELKSELKKAIKFESDSSDKLRAGEKDFRSMLVRHRQILRKLKALSVKLSNIADRFKLNNLGKADAELLETTANGIDEALDALGKKVSTSLVVLSGIDASKQAEESKKCAENAVAFSDALKVLLSGLDRFENFSELLRDLKGLRSVGEEIKTLIDQDIKDWYSK